MIKVIEEESSVLPQQMTSSAGKRITSGFISAQSKLMREAGQVLMVHQPSCAEFNHEHATTNKDTQSRCSELPCWSTTLGPINGQASLRAGPASSCGNGV